MIQLIDTHAHLYVEQFKDDAADMIQRAIDTSVEKMYLPNIDESTVESMLSLCANYPSTLFPMMGLHPCSVDDGYMDVLDRMEQSFKKHTYSAIGETGIDLYWDDSKRKDQIASFRRQIQWAKDFDLPIVIHSRSALHLTIDIITEAHGGRLKGIFHCFDGDLDQAKRIIDLGFFIGIGGAVTYKKSKVVDVIRSIGLSNVVLETDSPYLSPVPKRGKRNESAFLMYTAKFIAESLDLPLKTVAEVTTRNARGIFNKHKTETVKN